jgi:protocatechuate 3,4-dioxygenase beta subunit
MSAHQRERMTGQPPSSRFTRRQALTGLGIASGVTLTGRRAFAQMEAGTVAKLLPGANICILTPQAVEGPYYFDPELERADITEAHQGVPLGLLLQVVEASDCSALPGARVDVWHANALGHYSGYQGQGDERDVNTEGKTFLRGTQFTDAGGEVTFATIYPGWYSGRTPHIHFKVFVDDKNVVTGQIYFPDALSEFIYTQVAPYNTRGRERDTTNDRDGVLQSSGGGRETFIAIREEADRYLAALIIGIDREAKPSAAKGPGGAPPPGPPPSGSPPGEPPPDSGRRGALVPGIGT